MYIPHHDCELCPRLADFRAANRIKFPDKFNAPVPSFGDLSARLLVVGLAPGLKGANFSGRPFTGDYAGVLLYSTLLKFGFAAGNYDARPDDGLTLSNCRITNAVRCVPPENKPEPSETRACNDFLKAEIAAMPHLRVVLTLGQVSHAAVLRAAGMKAAAHKFAHGAVHETPGGNIKVVNSYHCSRYNTQTRRLTEAMFHEVFEKIRAIE